VLNNSLNVSPLVSGFTVDISSTFSDGFVVQCVQLMPNKFLHFYCLSLLSKFRGLTYLKHLTRYGDYAGQVEDIVIARLATI